MAALSFPDPPLTDGVVLLRPWRAEDTPQRQAGFADPLCQRFSWSGFQPPTVEDVTGAVAQHEQERLAGESLNLAVVPATDPDRISGAASVYDVDLDQGRAAVGYWLAPHARGQGAATRTLRLLTAWMLDTLAVARVELTSAPDNVASQRVALRCGFVREGVLRAHLPFKGTRRDTMVFSLLPGELR